MSLWNQQGSNVLRGSLIVIPIGRALLYAEPIYLQAQHSPMQQLRLVVLALQDRLAYGTTLEAALAGLFGGAASSLPGPLSSTVPGLASATAPAPVPAEAGQKLEALRRALDQLDRRSR